MSQHVLPHVLSPAVLHPPAAPLLYLYQACCCLPLLILFIIRSLPLPPLPHSEGDIVPVHPHPHLYSFHLPAHIPAAACHLQQKSCISAEHSIYGKITQCVRSQLSGLNGIWSVDKAWLFRFLTLQIKINSSVFPSKEDIILQNI